LGFSDVLSALGGGGMGNAAGIDNYKVGSLRHFSIVEAKLLKKLPNLLAFILINFTAKGIYGKSFHNMI